MQAFFQQWFVESNRGERIWMMAVMDFKLRYYENKLGLLWALVKPLSQIIIYTIAFDIVFESDMENYSIYLFSGLVIWNFILESSSGAIPLLASKKYLYEYTNMSKLEIYLAVTLSNVIGMVLNLLIYFMVAAMFGVFPTMMSFAAIPILIVTAILGLGLSMILSNLFLLFSDINQIWNVVVQFLFFLSPIIYDTSVFMDKIPFMAHLNPVSGLIINFRQAVLYGGSLDGDLFFWTILYTAGILAAGLAMMKRVSPKASEILT